MSSGTPFVGPLVAPPRRPAPSVLQQKVIRALATGNADELRLYGIAAEFGFDQDDAGTRKKKRKMTPKDRWCTEETRRLYWEYYLSRRPLFRSVYRMELSCFELLMAEIRSSSQIFERNFDAIGEGGIFPEVKILACLRVLVTGLSSVQVADMYKIGRSTLDRCFAQFVELVPDVLSKYTAFPTDEEAQKICDDHEAKHGFKGMLGSLDCLHWHWGQCMMVEHYAYCGKSGKPTMVLEAICKQNLKFLYHNFGSPGVQNDISILRSSPIVSLVSQGKWPTVQYEVGGVSRDKPYVLCDGIYPSWDVLVVAFARPMSQGEKLFTKKQESARKDIERAFGVLRKRFDALRKACLKKDKDKIIKMMSSMIALHNLIVEFNEGLDQCDYLAEELLQNPAAFEADTSTWQEERADEILSRDVIIDAADEDEDQDAEAQASMDRLRQLFNADRHMELREGLVRDFETQ